MVRKISLEPIAAEIIGRILFTSAFTGLAALFGYLVICWLETAQT
jgi:hypothetical protein